MRFLDAQRASVLAILVAETARHAGQLDIVRELLDGRAGPGSR